MRIIDADTLKAYFFRPYSNEESYSNIDIEKIIDKQITVKPEQKTGKWITEEIGLRSYATKCSVCGTILHRGYNFDNAQEYTKHINGFGRLDKFCHECGAKMEVDK